MSDFISRQAVIDYLMINMAWFDEDGRMIDDWSEKMPIITDLINGVPSAWVSVKDRLPDQAGFKCFVRGVNVFDQAFVFTAFTGYGDLNWYTDEMTYMSLMKGPYDNRVSDSWTITHWMPLPEPMPETQPKGQ